VQPDVLGDFDDPEVVVAGGSRSRIAIRLVLART
jgi:hypothetical protein